MNISQGIVLNLSAGGIPPRLRMVQGDSNTRTIEASLWDGAQPYAVPDGSSVMVRFRKPDGTGGLYDTTEGGSPITFDGNNVAAPVATQMLAVPGEVAAEMDIYGAGTGAAAEKLATFRFVVEVAPCVLPDAEIISSDYYNVLTAKIAEALEAVNDAEAAASSAASSAAAAAQSAAGAAATVEGAVKYNAVQGLTAAQQEQARENIGAASEAATTAALAGKQPTLTAGQNIAINNNTIGTKAFPCNPNLLDNWYFGNPVNQRGQTSYISESATNQIYSIDRWKATGALTVGDSYISVTNATNSSILRQWIEYPSKFKQKTMTFSVQVAKAVSSLSLFIRYDNYANVVTKVFSSLAAGDVVSITGTIPDVKLTELFVQAHSIVGQELALTAVKLELGTEQTLAHQDANGNWVLNEIPNYGEQLRRCQRYCIRLNLDLMPATIIGGTNIVFFVPLPVTMRTVPAIATNNFLVRATVGGANQADFAFAASSLRNNGVIITATKTNHGLTGASLSAGTSGSLLSADL